MKKILKFILFLLPWFLSSIIFPFDMNYYNSLNLPFFAIPKFLFPIIWTILYFLIAYSVYQISEVYSFKDTKSYNKILIINYIFNQLFMFFFFTLKNPFLGFVDVLLTFITSLFLYYETNELDNKARKALTPYPYFLLYATLLSLTVYFMNF